MKPWPFNNKGSTGQVRPVNIYWRDAIGEGLTIIKVGKALVALRGADRLRVYWYGSEADEAATTTDAYMRHTTGEVNHDS